MAAGVGEPRLRARAVVAGLVPLLVALAVYQYWYRRIVPVLTGDEAHYLVMARSIGRDADLDLANDYREFAADQFVRGTLSPEGQAADYRNDGKLRSVHSPGLSALLAPVARGADPTAPARNAMTLLAALLAWQLFGLLRDLFPRSGLARWGVWAAVCFPFPMLGFSDQIYPEVPAALLFVVAVRLLVRRWGRVWASATASALAASAPWLHVRFTPVTVGIGAAAWISATSSRRDRAAGDGHGRLRVAARSLAAVGAPLAVSALGVALVFQHLYGSPMPSAAYSHGAVGIPPQGLVQSYRVGVGSLLSPTSGLVPYAPFLIVGLAGMAALVARFGRAAAAACAVAAVYALVVVPFGPFAYVLPGRYLVVLVPLLAAAAVAALDRWRPAAYGAAVLAMLSAAVVWTHRSPPTYGALYDTGRVHTLERTAFLWPTSSDDLGEDVLSVSPTTRLADGTEATPGTFIRARVGYVANATIVGGCAPRALQLTVVPVDRPQQPLGSAETVCAANGDATATVRFRSPKLVQVSLHVSGLGPQAGITALDAGVERPDSDRHRSIRAQAWKALAWVAVFAGLNWLLVRLGKERARGDAVSTKRPG